MDLIVRNAQLPDRKELIDIGIKEGRFEAIARRLALGGSQEIDAGGNLVSPPFIDPHIHLDAVLTAGKPRPNRSGTHLEGVEVWSEYKKSFLNDKDIKARAQQAIEWEAAKGTLMIRTHVDVCDPNLTALKAILELRESVKDLIDLQIVALPQDGILTSSRGPELMEEAMRLGADLVGGIPHCEWTREDGVNSLGIVFDLAQKYDRAIDIHCDETDDDHSRFLEGLAAKTIRHGYQGRVSASHTTAMHSYNNAYAFKLFGLLQQAKINIIANPFDNIVLQGRFDTYPKRRGVTRVKELLQNGINVSLGHDSIMDPWYPLGCGDMLQAAQLAIHVCHMSGYDEMHRMFDTITANSAVTFGCAEMYGIEKGKPANLVILDAGSVLEALRLTPARLYVIRTGRVIAHTDEPKTNILSIDTSQVFPPLKSIGLPQTSPCFRV